MSAWPALDQSARLAFLKEQIARGRFPVTYSIFSAEEPIFSSDPRFRPADPDDLPPTAVLIGPSEGRDRALDIGRRRKRTPRRQAGRRPRNVLPGLLGPVNVDLDLPDISTLALWLLFGAGALVLLVALTRRR